MAGLGSWLLGIDVVWLQCLMKAEGLCAAWPNRAVAKPER